MSPRIRQLFAGLLSALPPSRLIQVVFSITDQALSVGGMFVANVALARATSKEEYGMFALSYSVFNFLAGLHNAAILEPYTVYGAGRYSSYHPQYRWIIWKNNALLGLALTVCLLLIWVVLAQRVSSIASRSVLGLALSSAALLGAALMRRMLYVERKVQLAARMSSIFFLALLISLAGLMSIGKLNSLTVFLAVGLSSIVGALGIIRELPRRVSLEAFAEGEPNHWSEHWKYARWVLATAFVFQLTTQAYYWLVAGFLSLKEVAELRAMYMLVMPVDQVFTAVTLVVLPMMSARYALKQIDKLLFLWKGYLLAFLAIGFTFVLGVLLVGPALMHAIYGGKFDYVASLLGTLAFLPVIMGVGNTMNVVMKSAEKPNMVFYAYVASGAATFAIGIPLMINFGVRGAVYGMLVSGCVYTLALGVAFFSLVPRLQSLRVADSPNLRF